MFCASYQRRHRAHRSLRLLVRKGATTRHAHQHRAAHYRSRPLGRGVTRAASVAVDGVILLLVSLKNRSLKQAYNFYLEMAGAAWQAGKTASPYLVCGAVCALMCNALRRCLLAKGGSSVPCAMGRRRAHRLLPACLAYQYDAYRRRARLTVWRVTASIRHGSPYIITAVGKMNILLRDSRCVACGAGGVVWARVAAAHLSSPQL